MSQTTPFIKYTNIGDVKVVAKYDLESYHQGKADAIDERASLLAFICRKYGIPLMDMNCTVDEWEQLNEQTNHDKFGKQTMRK